jgi:hypothetical protein
MAKAAAGEIPAPETASVDRGMLGLAVEGTGWALSETASRAAWRAGGSIAWRI